MKCLRMKKCKQEAHRYAVRFLVGNAIRCAGIVQMVVEKKYIKQNVEAYQ